MVGADGVQICNSLSPHDYSPEVSVHRRLQEPVGVRRLPLIPCRPSAPWSEFVVAFAC
jgi:hypothetical protein